MIGYGSANHYAVNFGAVGQMGVRRGANYLQELMAWVHIK